MATEAENKSLTASRYAARTLQQLVHRTTITDICLAINLFLCCALHWRRHSFLLASTILTYLPTIFLGIGRPRSYQPRWSRHRSNRVSPRPRKVDSRPDSLSSPHCTNVINAPCPVMAGPNRQKKARTNRLSFVVVFVRPFTRGCLSSPSVFLCGRRGLGHPTQHVSPKEAPRQHRSARTLPEPTPRRG